MPIQSVITGTGSYIPNTIKTNKDFAVHNFYGEDSIAIKTPPEEVAEKFKLITGIEERRYVDKDLNTSDIAYLASVRALEDAGIDPETIDQIILAHNFGNVLSSTIQTDVLPALASRVKHQLGIKNPACVPYDILFGCPGWVQGLIQAHSFIQSGMAKRCLVVGAETLSRVVDEYDRDSMIFSDGAGACIVEAQENTSSGILSYSVAAHCGEEVDYLHLGKSYFPNSDPRIRYIKMKGRKVYEYAMKYVPEAMKDCLEKSGVGIESLKKVFLHQANEKMDEGITKRLFKLLGLPEMPPSFMPMSIHKLGNSSVATVPTLFDLVRKHQLKEHELETGDVIMFASVGAGMNINAVCYRM